MLQSMVVKELRLLFRLKTIFVASVLLIALLILAFYSAWHSYHRTLDEVNGANHLFRHQWEQLTIGNTHGAAHYGTWLFKPHALLSIFDRGITDFTGAAYRIEAHKQHNLLMQTAPVTANYLRFGTLTMATILQVLLPLLLIFLLFDIHTSEKRLGTLPLLYLQGAGRKQIIAAKAIAALLLAIVLLLPAVVLLFITAFTDQSAVTGKDVTSILLLFTGYLAYSSFFALLSVGVSILSGSSRQSLLSLLGIWLLLIIVLPRVMAGVYERKHPLPSQFALQKKISDAEKYGLHGKEPLMTRRKKIEDSLLAAYKADSIHQLPVNADAVWMQFEEDYMERVYATYTRETDSILGLQNRYTTYGRWLNPLLAIRAWSMSLSGTDIDQLVYFRQQAFAYRNTFIRQLNNKLAETNAGAHSNAAVVTTAFYKNMPPFYYQPLPLSFILRQHKTTALSLLGWLLFACLWFTWLFNRKNIV